MLGHVDGEGNELPVDNMNVAESEGDINADEKDSDENDEDFE